jgi:hypothetical protein
MTTEAKIARRKLPFLQLAAEMTNVSKACKMPARQRLTSSVAPGGMKKRVNTTPMKFTFSYSM